MRRLFIFIFLLVNILGYGQNEILYSHLFVNFDSIIITENEFKTLDKFPLVYLNSFSLEKIKSYSFYEASNRSVDFLSELSIFSDEERIIFTENFQIYVLGRTFNKYCTEINSYFFLVKSINLITGYEDRLYMLNFQNNYLRSIINVYNQSYLGGLITNINSKIIDDSPWYISLQFETSYYFDDSTGEERQPVILDPIKIVANTGQVNVASN